MLFTGNLIGGTNDACIQSPDEYCDSYLITGNYFLNWTGDGVRLSLGDHHVLSGNAFYPASTGQDYFRGTFESVVGNTFYSTGYINGAKNFGGNVFPDLSGAGTLVVPSGAASADMKKPLLWDTLTSSTTLWGSVQDHRIVDTTTGNKNITLPDTASVGFGQTLRFLKTVTANNFSILSQGSDVINHDGTSATTINNIINSSNTGHLELISISDNGTPTWLVTNRTVSAQTVFTGSATWNPGTVGSWVAKSVSVSCPGATVGMFVKCSLSSLDDGPNMFTVSISGFVESGGGSVRVSLANMKNASVAIPSGTVKVSASAT